MWILKSEAEATADKQKARRLYNKKFVLRWLVITVVFSLLPNRYSSGPHEVSLRRFIATALVCAIMVSLLPLFIRRDPKIWICPKCEHSKHPDGNTSCLCGGSFVKSSLLKWVKDE